MNKPDEKTLALLNVRIAELMGWKSEHDDFYFDHLAWVQNGDRSTRCATMDLAPFTGSLDAIHEAENSLDRDNHRRFRMSLIAVAADDDDPRSIVSASAWQRAIALDRTLSPSPIL